MSKGKYIAVKQKIEGICCHSSLDKWSGLLSSMFQDVVPCHSKVSLKIKGGKEGGKRRKNKDSGKRK